MPVLSREVRLEALRHCVRGCTLRLFANDYEPCDEDAVGDFVEADFPGYEPKELDDEQWKDKGLSLSYPAQVFVLTEDLDIWQRVYGWYLTRDDCVVMAHRTANAPERIVTKGSKIKVPGLSLAEKP